MEPRILSNTNTIFYYQPKKGKRIGSSSEFKIKKMIEQEYGDMAKHRDVLHCGEYDFVVILNGDVHNDEWL